MTRLSLMAFMTFACIGFNERISILRFEGPDGTPGVAENYLGVRENFSTQLAVAIAEVPILREKASAAVYFADRLPPKGELLAIRRPVLVITDFLAINFQYAFERAPCDAHKT